MGFSFGGEWACAAVLLGEVIRPESRGKAVGAMQSGWAIGWAIALGLYLLFFSIMPAETAWRALFWVGSRPRCWSSLFGVMSKSRKFSKRRKPISIRRARNRIS